MYKLVVITTYGEQGEITGFNSEADAIRFLQEYADEVADYDVVPYKEAKSLRPDREKMFKRQNLMRRWCD